MNFQSVPVLMYHHVNFHAGDFITVSVARFHEQMKGISESGIRTLSAEEYRAFRRREIELREPSIHITFDDAWLDIYLYAFPILQTYQLKFTVFVPMGWAVASQEAQDQAPHDLQIPKHGEAEAAVHSGTAPWLITSLDQLASMKASGLMSLENHTAHHCVVGEQEDKAWIEDCALGKSLLQRYFGIASKQLCWPKGRHHADLKPALLEMDIDTTYLVRRGVNRATGDSFYNHRFTVKDHSWSWLKRQIEIFQNPIRGYLYGRLKPDRYREKIKSYFRLSS